MSGQYDQLNNTGMTVQFRGNVAAVTGEYREKIEIKGKSGGARHTFYRNLDSSKKGR